MKTVQPPITSEQELVGYRAGAERLLRMIERHEADLTMKRHKDPLDMHRLDQIRCQLHHLSTAVTRASRTR